MYKVDIDTLKEAVKLLDYFHDKTLEPTFENGELVFVKTTQQKAAKKLSKKIKDNYLNERN
jgi:hypothetical protein